MTSEMKYQDPLAAMVKEHKLTHHDLHAHLLGCGDHRFWVDDMMHLYLPKRYSFFGKGTTPHVGRFPPLIFFDEEEKEFFPYEETLEFLDLLENDLKGSGGGILKQIHEVLRFLEDLKKGILKQIYEVLKCLGKSPKRLDCLDELKDSKKEVFGQIEDVLEFLKGLWSFTISGSEEALKDIPKQTEKVREFLSDPNATLNPIRDALKKFENAKEPMSNYKAFFGFFKGLFDDAESQKNFVDFFKDGIEYDVVYSVKNLALGLCLDGEDNEIRKSHICEILECHLEDFKMALVFNARKQQFQRVEGITNSKLLQICKSKMAMQFVRNGFSMLSQEGEFAGSSDFASYRGHFTPQFYPGRFALKDSIYEQRPDVLMRLLEHIDSRCQKVKCSHGHNEAWKVDYMELSIGVGDASKRHIMAFLAEKIMSKTKLKKALLRETTSKLFQQPGTTTFRYLAGFNRGKVHLPLGPPILFDTALPQIIPKSSTVETPNDSQKCWKLMKTYPHRCINLFNESLSDGNFFSDFKGMFKGMHKDLSDFKTTWSTGEELKLDESWIVGFDLFGDELGTPYCPFASTKFQPFLKESKFGCRVHFGEGIPAVGELTDSFVAWIVHMFVGLVGIFKTSKITQTRVGHGVAIARLLSLRESKEWKPFVRVLYRSCLLASSVIVNKDKNERKVPVEINLTSNRYLLPEHEGRENVLALNPIATCFLSTDDDGVWPLNGTLETGHHIGLHGEYVMAASRRMINLAEVIKMVENAKKSKFGKDSSSDSASSEPLKEGNPAEVENPPPGCPLSKDSVKEDILKGKRVKWLIGKVIFDPAFLETKKEEYPAVYTFIQNTCPWIGSIDINYSEVVKSDPASEDYDSMKASEYLQNFVFGSRHDNEAELFVSMAHRLCSFQGENPYIIFEEGDETKRHVWVTENHPTKTIFKRGFSKGKSTCLYLFFDQLDAFKRFQSVFPSRPEGVKSCTVYGTFTLPKASKVPDWMTFVPISPCPLGMSVVPLLYYSALLPVLAAFYSKQKLNLVHPKRRFPGSQPECRKLQREVYKSSTKDEPDTLKEEPALLFKELKLSEENQKHFSRLVVLGYVPRAYRKLPDGNGAKCWTLPLEINSKFYSAADLEEDEENADLIKLLCTYSTPKKTVENLLNLGLEVVNQIGSEPEIIGPIVKEIWEDMSKLDHDFRDTAKFGPNLDKLTKSYFNGNPENEDQFEVLGSIRAAVRNNQDFRFGNIWQLEQCEKYDFLKKVIEQVKDTEAQGTGDENPKRQKVAQSQ
ncbi:hypothetical protein BASA81_002548 [Batrachochytrium salamandrivorans]|nr:hypothetical protein BASA81_002548 [Batrachochytrium salamandrivorans]